MTRRLISQSILGLALGVSISAQPQDVTTRAIQKTVWALDYSALPTDAEVHNRTKWSNGNFIYIDDDEAAPSLYVFDKSGKTKFSTILQIPNAERLRIDDFAAGPDGSVWAGGNATSKSGQRSFFLAHFAANEPQIQVVQTAPYRPRQLTVAADGTVWTVGYSVIYDSTGRSNADLNENILRHFDASGKELGSSVRASTVGLDRIKDGYLAASGDRIGWYSVNQGVGAYVEFSTDMSVIHTYSLAPTEDKKSVVEGFVLTPGGHAFVLLRHAKATGYPPGLYELNRTTNSWMGIDPPRDSNGRVPMLQGNDGESLIFTGPPDKSKLQVFDVSQVIGG